MLQRYFRELVDFSAGANKCQRAFLASFLGMGWNPTSSSDPKKCQQRLLNFNNIINTFIMLVYRYNLINLD